MALIHQFDGGRPLGSGSAALEETPRLHPDRIRELPIGHAWLIRRGRAAKVEVDRAPHVEPCRLPAPADISAEPRLESTEAPKQIAYLEQAV
jgi:hypothetical protein